MHEATPIEIETATKQTETGWADIDGFVGPYRPGKGPRTDPRGEFPTGPDIGSTLPNFQSKDAHGKPFDLHAARNGKPAVVMFYRSAVW